MTELPTNQVLTAIDPRGDPEATLTLPASAANDFPKVLYHQDSKVGALIDKLVISKEEADALGDEWGDLARLQIETAPAAKGD